MDFFVDGLNAMKGWANEVESAFSGGGGGKRGADDDDQGDMVNLLIFCPTLRGGFSRKIGRDDKLMTLFSATDDTAPGSEPVREMPAPPSEMLWTWQGRNLDMENKTPADYHMLPPWKQDAGACGEGGNKKFLIYGLEKTVAQAALTVAAKAPPTVSEHNAIVLKAFRTVRLPKLEREETKKRKELEAQYAIGLLNVLEEEERSRPITLSSSFLAPEQSITGDVAADLAALGGNEKNNNSDDGPSPIDLSADLKSMASINISAEFRALATTAPTAATATTDTTPQPPTYALDDDDPDAADDNAGGERHDDGEHGLGAAHNEEVERRRAELLSLLQKK